MRGLAMVSRSPRITSGTAKARPITTGFVQSHLCAEICPGVLRNTGISSVFSDSQPGFKCDIHYPILNSIDSADMGQS